MKRNRSTGLVWPLMLSAVCCKVVRLNTWTKNGHQPKLTSQPHICKPGVLCARPCTHSHTVLACGCHDLATVELQARDRVLVPDRVRDGTCTKIPDLQTMSNERQSRIWEIGCLHFTFEDSL